MSALATGPAPTAQQTPSQAAGQVWQKTFLAWPAELPRRGVLVTQFGEQIPFSNFLASPVLLLLERTNPDSLGSRKIMLPYEEVAAVKFTDVLKAKAFRPLGFELPVRKNG